MHQGTQAVFWRRVVVNPLVDWGLQGTQMAWYIKGVFLSISGGVGASRNTDLIFDDPL